MSDADDPRSDRSDAAPGDEGVNRREPIGGAMGYLVGLCVAALLTATSFYFAGSKLVYGPAVPVLLIVLAIAQMGVHLVFFLHITTGPDNTNNVLALAFGVMVVALVIFGSIWIMGHLDHNMMMPPMRMDHI